MKVGPYISNSRLRVAFLLFMVAATSHMARGTQNSVPWMTGEQRENLLKRITDSLPSGSSVTRVVENQVPDEWRSFDTRTLGIEGKNGERSFRIWIVPEDWVGIRLQKPVLPRYGAEVFLLEQFRMIPQTGDYAVYQSLERLRLISARISGQSKGLNTRNEEQTKALIERFCIDQPCRDEAAYSLIVLGVSARPAILNCAEHGSGEPQETCLGVLYAWPDPETLRVLHDVLSRKPSVPASVKAAAWSLRYIGVTAASGPALLEALRNEPGREAEGVLLDALADSHYAPAAPGILTRLERAGKDCSKCANALAALRYSPAIPEIQKLVRTKDISSEWLLEEHRRRASLDLAIPEVALLRLTAPWGASINGVRLLLIPPATVPASGKIQFAGLLENESRPANNLLLMDFVSAAVIVDGKVYEHPIGVWDGPAHVPINAVTVRSFELPDDALDGKSHRVQIRAASAFSNEIVVTAPVR